MGNTHSRPQYVRYDGTARRRPSKRKSMKEPYVPAPEPTGFEVPQTWPYAGYGQAPSQFSQPQDSTYPPAFLPQGYPGHQQQQASYPGLPGGFQPYGQAPAQSRYPEMSEHRQMPATYQPHMEHQYQQEQQQQPNQYQHEQPQHPAQYQHEQQQQPNQYQQEQSQHPTQYQQEQPQLNPYQQQQQQAYQHQEQQQPYQHQQHQQHQQPNQQQPHFAPFDHSAQHNMAQAPPMPANPVPEPPRNSTPAPAFMPEYPSAPAPAPAPPPPPPPMNMAPPGRPLFMHYPSQEFRRPRDAPFSPLTNPLPTPPRDIYELEPYKSLMNGSALAELVSKSAKEPPPVVQLSAATVPAAAVPALVQDPVPAAKPRKRGLFGSLLRSASRRKKDKEKEVKTPARNPIPVAWTVPAPQAAPAAQPVRVQLHDPAPFVRVSTPSPVVVAPSSPPAETTHTIPQPESLSSGSSSGPATTVLHPPPPPGTPTSPRFRSPEQTWGSSTRRQRSEDIDEPQSPRSRRSRRESTPQQMSSPLPLPIPAPGRLHPSVLGVPGFSQPVNSPAPRPLHMAPEAPVMPIENTIPFSRTIFPHLSGFLLASAHSIHYRNRDYPSAFHLLEAMKFMHDAAEEEDPGFEQLVDRIAHCQSVQEVLEFMQGVEPEWIREDWERVLLVKVDEVLFLKMKQHDQLAGLLLSTRDAVLVYAEPDDTFWGATEDGGRNELGRSLMRVREALREALEMDY